MAEGSSAQKRKWTPTAKALDVFLAHLDPDRDQAGAKYEQIRRTLLTFFRCNGCPNAEDHVDETLDRVMRRLSEVTVTSLAPFIRGVARRVASEVHRKSTEVLFDDIPEPASWHSMGEENEEEMTRRIRCLERAMDRLRSEDRQLIAEWYLYEKRQKIDSKRRLAEIRGTSVGNLRVKAYRARQQLQRLVEECMSVPSKIM